jgi:perosamine synthetase
MGNQYLEVMNDSNLFIPQKTQNGFRNTYWTFPARFLGNEYNISWYDFRKKYVENGGDGIYSAHQTVNNEPCFKNSKLGYGDVPVAESLQKELMLFTTNQKDENDRSIQINALQKTIQFFK